jgi:hypothetical protein
MLEPHLHILPEAQQKLWPLLAPCKDMGFCLYGGTAIALHLGHRVSVDFDFFSHLPLDETKEKLLLESLPFLADAKTLQMEINTRTYSTSEGVALSFFGNINIGRVGEPSLTNDGGLELASLKDLMGTKLAVLLGRVESKDYRDIAAILRSGMDLHEGLSYALALYPQFPPAECIRALTFFESPQLQSLPKEDKEILVNAAKKFRPSASLFAPIVSSSLMADGPDGDDENAFLRP